MPPLLLSNVLYLLPFVGIPMLDTVGPFLRYDEVYLYPGGRSEQKTYLYVKSVEGAMNNAVEQGSSITIIREKGRSTRAAPEAQHGFD